MTKFGQAEYSDKGRSIRRFRNGRIYYWIACRRYSGSIHNVSLYCGKAGRRKYVKFGQVILSGLVIPF